MLSYVPLPLHSSFVSLSLYLLSPPSSPQVLRSRRPRRPIIIIARHTTMRRLILHRQRVARDSTLAKIARIHRQMASIIQIDRSANANPIHIIEIPKSIQDLLTCHTLRICRIRIACEHGSAAPSEPLTLKVTRCVDVGGVVGVFIERVVAGESAYARGVAAEGFAQAGTSFIATDLRGEGSSGCRSRGS